MEFEGVSEEMERAAQRVAVAIEADEFRLFGYKNGRFIGMEYPAEGALYRGSWGGTRIEWTIIKEGSALQSLRIGNPGTPPVDACLVYRLPSGLADAGFVWESWTTMPNALYQPQALLKEHMVRTLYRLGIETEDEPEIADFYASFSMHEKLELRLSMPREFWPKAWLQGQ